MPSNIPRCGCGWNPENTLCYCSQSLDDDESNEFDDESGDNEEEE